MLLASSSREAAPWLVISSSLFAGSTVEFLFPFNADCVWMEEGATECSEKTEERIREEQAQRATWPGTYRLVDDILGPNVAAIGARTHQQP
jgi:hypothetical protein